METAKRKQQQNVKVVVRVRPFTRSEQKNDDEVLVNFISHKEIAVRGKKYEYDRVFGPECTQYDIYLTVIAPIIPDIIAGYNCTVFTYGQTGTGKTYTMTGGDPDCAKDWKEDPSAGCIPRAALNIFDEMRACEADYTIRVSYLELYNEEIRDLLSDDDKLLPLQIYTDPKNKGSVCIQALREVTVCRRNEIYDLLARGANRRKTAPTLMNHQSSRSHTVFTITVSTRQSLVSGDSMIKTGKLHLVDLAGSENISKSGSKDLRALESANINKSLLTLGRVIHALVEKQQHIPYRDSKLTRILQDSLGGKTITCIVATVSPAFSSLEETICTLEYAQRARDIKNCPEINEQVGKVQLEAELAEEFERIKNDLLEARKGEGFYIDKQNYNDLLEQVGSTKDRVYDLRDDIQQLNKEKDDLEQVRQIKLNSLSSLIESFKTTKTEIQNKKSIIKSAIENISKERHLSDLLEKESNNLYYISDDLYQVAEKASTKGEFLYRKIAKLFTSCKGNDEILKDTGSKITDLALDIKNKSKEAEELLENNRKLQKRFTGVCDELDLLKHLCEDAEALKSQTINTNPELYKSNFEETISFFESLIEQFNESLNQIVTKMNSHHDEQCSRLNEESAKILQKINNLRDSMYPKMEAKVNECQMVINEISTVIHNGFMEFEDDSVDEDFKNFFPQLVEERVLEIETHKELSNLLAARLARQNMEDFKETFNKIFHTAVDNHVQLLTLHLNQLNLYHSKCQQQLSTFQMEYNRIIQQIVNDFKNFQMDVTLTLENLGGITIVNSDKLYSFLTETNKIMDQVSNLMKTQSSILKKTEEILHSHLENVTKFVENKYIIGNKLMSEPPVGHEGDTPIKQTLSKPNIQILTKKSICQYNDVSLNISELASELDTSDSSEDIRSLTSNLEKELFKKRLEEESSLSDESCSEDSSTSHILSEIDTNHLNNNSNEQT